MGKKVLIVSVGGSSELIVNAIAQTQPRPDFVYFLCSTGNAGSDATVERTIVPTAKAPQVADRLRRDPNRRRALRREGDRAMRGEGPRMAVNDHRNRS
jgi:hypothetical protein